MHIRNRQTGDVSFPVVRDAEGQVLYGPLLLKGNVVTQVDDEHWEALCEVLNHKWLEAMGKSHLEMVDDDEDSEPAHMKANEAVSAAKACETLGELDDLVDRLGADEERSTVLAAVDKRREDLGAE